MWHGISRRRSRALKMSAMDVLGRVGRHAVAAYRRSGADVPFGDPLPSHGTEMEGWFWRISDAATGRVVVALCSANRDPTGDWSTAAIALHPGGAVRSAAIDGVAADRSRFAVRADAVEARVDASMGRLNMRIEDGELDLTFVDEQLWPKAFGGGGVFSCVPFLNQYWHPYRLGGTAAGTVRLGDQRWKFTDATLYCERNWGSGFPPRWWWGQAHDFGDADVCVAFSGGVLALGPLHREVTGMVVRLGDRIIRITPPALVNGTADGADWRVRARTLRYQIDVHGQGTGAGPHVLPVPLPAEHRNVDADFEYLAGRLHLRVQERGRPIFDGTSQLAGLEIGSR